MKRLLSISGRGDRYLGHSSRHTQVPVPVTRANNGYFYTGVFAMANIYMDDGIIEPLFSDWNYNLNVKTISVYR